MRRRLVVRRSAGFLLIESERPEEIERAEVTPVVEPGGQHADDFVRFAVDAKRAADDVGSAAEAVLPATLADDEDAIVAREIFARQEIAAELRLDAQGGEEIGAWRAWRGPSRRAGRVRRGSCRPACRRRSRRSPASRAADRGSRPARRGPDGFCAVARSIRSSCALSG